MRITWIGAHKGMNYRAHCSKEPIIMVDLNAVVSLGWGWGVADFAQARTSGLKDAKIRFRQPGCLVLLMLFTSFLGWGENPANLRPGRVTDW